MHESWQPTQTSGRHHILLSPTISFFHFLRAFIVSPLFMLSFLFPTLYLTYLCLYLCLQFSLFPHMAASTWENYGPVALYHQPDWAQMYGEELTWTSKGHPIFFCIPFTASFTPCLFLVIPISSPFLAFFSHPSPQPSAVVIVFPPKQPIILLSFLLSS